MWQRSSMTIKMYIPSRSRCDTIKSRHCSMAMREQYRSKCVILISDIAIWVKNIIRTIIPKQRNHSLFFNIFYIFRTTESILAKLGSRNICAKGKSNVIKYVYKFFNTPSKCNMIIYHGQLSWYNFLLEDCCKNGLIDPLTVWFTCTPLILSWHGLYKYWLHERVTRGDNFPC